MDVLHDRVAGLDVHKQTVAACVRSPGSDRARRAETREFETFVDDLERLRDWLVAEQVTHVAMEATGVYWKPVWFVLEDAGFELELAAPVRVQARPGERLVLDFGDEVPAQHGQLAGDGDGRDLEPAAILDASIERAQWTWRLGGGEGGLDEHPTRLRRSGFGDPTVNGLSGAGLTDLGVQTEIRHESIG